MTGERRMLATYLLGHDRTAPPVPRAMARLLSAYERATARAVLATLVQDAFWFEIGPPDAPFLWAIRRLAFRLAGRPRGEPDPAPDAAVPGSGWPGSLLVLFVWMLVIGGSIASLRAILPG